MREATDLFGDFDNPDLEFEEEVQTAAAVASIPVINVEGGV